MSYCRECREEKGQVYNGACDDCYIMQKMGDPFMEDHPYAPKQSSFGVCPTCHKSCPLGKACYTCYMDSEEWVTAKERKFRTVPVKECELCSSTNNLDIHHATYDNLGDEKMDDLQILCHECHIETYHARRLKLHEYYPEALKPNYPVECKNPGEGKHAKQALELQVIIVGNGRRGGLTRP